jgi:hypothetical protein
LSSLLAGPVGLFADVLRLITHDSLTKLKSDLSTWRTAGATQR